MNRKALYIFLLFSCCLQLSVFAQNAKTVTMSVLGQGTNLEQARANALRNAIEQTYGAFVSSNTAILNDNLVKEEVITLSNGSVKKYEIINERSLPDGSFFSNLKVEVSINNLVSYVQQKGANVSFDGNLFAYNVKQREFYKQSELKVVNNTKPLLLKYLSNAFDYTLKVEEPILIGGDASESSRSYNGGMRLKQSGLQEFKVASKVTINSNENLNTFFVTLKNILSSISIPKDEVPVLEKGGFKVYRIGFQKEIYNLRNAETLLSIMDIVGNDLTKTMLDFTIFNEAEDVHFSYNFNFPDPSAKAYRNVSQQASYRKQEYKRIKPGSSDEIKRNFYLYQELQRPSSEEPTSRAEKIIDALLSSPSSNQSTDNYFYYYIEPFKFSEQQHEINRYTYYILYDKKESKLITDNNNKIISFNFDMIFNVDELQKINNFRIAK
jgi:hypothetical protein